MSGLPNARVRENPDGLCVEGAGRPPIRVRFRGYFFEADLGGEPPGGGCETFGLFAFGRLLELVVGGLLCDGRPREGWYGARARAQQQAAQAVARPLREGWLRLLRRAGARVLAVQRAILAATQGEASLARLPALYEEEYLARDVIAHPAAAIAVRHAWELTGGAGAAGQLARLGDWKALFSDIGESYRSLNRTLMNLPPRAPHRLVCGLRHVHLERPLRDRLELLAVVLDAEVRRGREAVFAPAAADHSRVIRHAGAGRLREALGRLGRHLRQPLDERRPGDVRQLVQFLADYPEPHAGHVVGLTERAIRWHRARPAEPGGGWAGRPDAEAGRPPIALPEAAGVTFLGTAGEIGAEGERMRHCAGHYAELAVRGGCYLFHVEHGGEAATVEVSPEGQVRQARGPHNRANGAAAYGRLVLGRWGAGLAAGRRARPQEGADAVPF